MARKFDFDMKGKVPEKNYESIDTFVLNLLQKFPSFIGETMVIGIKEKVLPIGEKGFVVFAYLKNGGGSYYNWINDDKKAYEELKEYENILKKRLFNVENKSAFYYRH